MSEQKKKRQRIYDLLYAETKPPKLPKWLEFLYDLHQGQNFNPIDYAIWGILENKTNAIIHPNIYSLNIAFEEEWNKMSEEFILKAYKSFRRRVNIIIEKNKKQTNNGCHI